MTPPDVSTQPCKAASAADFQILLNQKLSVKVVDFPKGSCKISIPESGKIRMFRGYKHPLPDSFSFAGIFLQPQNRNLFRICRTDFPEAFRSSIAAPVIDQHQGRILMIRKIFDEFFDREALSFIVCRNNYANLTHCL